MARRDARRGALILRRSNRIAGRGGRCGRVGIIRRRRCRHCAAGRKIVAENSDCPRFALDQHTGEKKRRRATSKLPMVQHLVPFPKQVEHAKRFQSHRAVEPIKPEGIAGAGSHHKFKQRRFG